MVYLAIGVTFASFLLAIMAPLQEMEDLTPAVTHTALTLDTVTPLGGSGTPEA